MAGPDCRAGTDCEAIWLGRVNACTSRAELWMVSRRARKAGVCTEALQQAELDRWNYLGTEAAIRLDERIKVLREVRNAAAAANRRCEERPGREGDPWLWGYGASKIVAYLSWKLGEARRAAGSEERKG